MNDMADRSSERHTELTQDFENLNTNIPAAPNPNVPRRSPIFSENILTPVANPFLGDLDISTRFNQLAAGELSSHPVAASTTRARRPYTRVDSEIEFRLREPSFSYDGRFAANAARDVRRNLIPPTTTRQDPNSR